MPKTRPRQSYSPPANEASTSQSKHTSVTATLDKLSSRKESSGGARNQRRRHRLLRHRQLRIPANPTTPAFVEQPISLRVSVRSQRPLICAISSTVAYDSRSRRSCSAAGMFAGDAPVTQSKIQHHDVVQRVEGSP